MPVKVKLKWIPVETPDAEFKIRSAWRILAEMVLSMVEVELDSESAPSTQESAPQCAK